MNSIADILKKLDGLDKFTYDPVETFPEKEKKEPEKAERNNKMTTLDNKFEVEIKKATGNGEHVSFKALLNVKETVQSKKDIDAFFTEYVTQGTATVVASAPAVSSAPVAKEMPWDAPTAPAYTASATTPPPAPSARPVTELKEGVVPVCNYCSSELWDNRNNKKSDKTPDFKCKGTDCEGRCYLKGNLLTWLK